jgi:hypothetical protein
VYALAVWTYKAGFKAPLIGHRQILPTNPMRSISSKQPTAPRQPKRQGTTGNATALPPTVPSSHRSKREAIEARWAASRQVWAEADMYTSNLHNQSWQAGRNLAGQKTVGMLARSNLTRTPMRDAQGTKPSPIGMSPRQRRNASESEMVVWKSASPNIRVDVSTVAAMASALRVWCKASGSKMDRQRVD